MGMTADYNYPNMPYTSQEEARTLVLEGLADVRDGRTSNFNEVCDRLEQKYTNAALQN